MYIIAVEATLRQQLRELQKYRQAGLRWLRSAKLHDKMSATQQAGRPHLLNDVLHYIQVCNSRFSVFCITFWYVATMAKAKRLNSGFNMNLLGLTLNSSRVPKFVSLGLNFKSKT